MVQDKKLDIFAFSGDEETIRRYQRKYTQYFYEGENVLDLGCGKGVFLELLRGKGVKGVGIDISQEVVEICRRKGLTVECTALDTYLAENSESFDGVFCSHLIEHLVPQEVMKLLEGINKGLKMGGRLIIITPNFRDIEVMGERFWLDITHVRPYPLDLLKELLKSYGFQIIAYGADKDTVIKSKRLFILHLLNRVRFGHRYRLGDIFIVGKKIR